ncbi:MAG: B12-binding domain-containing radical SAM protein [Theionarchaea archaeon]|nr:B12-binding domain-containing radical SAM protein [Theionarchaea archaeon]
MSCPPQVEKDHLRHTDCEIMIIAPELLTSTCTYSSCGRLATFFKDENPSGTVILSGEHASTLPESTLAELDVDIIAPFEFLLEQERALSLLDVLLKGKEPTCSGIWYKSGGKIRSNPPLTPHVVQDLSTLPPPRYSLLSPYCKEISRGDKIWVDLLTSRGCPFRCSFCSSMPAEEYHSMRYQSPEGVRAEIDEIRKAFGTESVFWEGIYDELYAYNLDHLRKIDALLEEEDIRVSLVFGRCSPFSRDIAEVVSHHSEGIIFGAETCNQDSLSLLGKGQTFHQVIAALKTARKASLTTVAQWMVGLPGETTSTIYQTLTTLNRLYTSGLAERVDIQMLVPLPWTEIYRHPEKFKITIESRTWDEYHELGYYPVYSTDTLTREQIWNYFLYAKLTNIYARSFRKSFDLDFYKKSESELQLYFAEREEDAFKSAFIRNMFHHGGME